MNRNISDPNNTKKIILNKRSDLINIPIQRLRTAKLNNFSGPLFEQIYQEAISIEHNQNIKTKKYSESKELSRSFFSPKINKNFDDNYIGNKLNILDKNKMIKIDNKDQNANIIEINSIKFEIKYDSIFGEEVGVLGSNNQLGNWNINNIFYLKWNNGNIWNGKMNINKPYINFEFKFVISYNRNIKKWENGENNKIIFDSLFNEIKYKKNGYLNKYEYYYDDINKELYLKCRWN